MRATGELIRGTELERMRLRALIAHRPEMHARRCPVAEPIDFQKVTIDCRSKMQQLIDKSYG
jgi:hypothetical protein